MIASSSAPGQCAGSTSPETNRAARSFRYSALRPDSPQARSEVARIRTTRSGATWPAFAAKRSQTDWAAFTEICWPTIERASVWNASPRDTRCTGPQARMIRPIVRSRRASARQASSQ